MKVTVTSIGPGDPELIPPMAARAIQDADVLIAYSYYLELISDLLSDEQEIIDRPIGEEKERAEAALDRAEAGKNVALISSGDAGIYGMGALLYEEAARRDFQGSLETVPGVTAFTAAAARLGAPIGHDMCSISLSDRMTPWATIEQRIRAAAAGDFVTALYNPKSRDRYWQLERFRELFLEHRDPGTPVAVVRQVYRADEKIRLSTLEEMDTDAVDMFCSVLVGNSQTFRFQDRLITPRGYNDAVAPQDGEGIQKDSFHHILKGLKDPYRPIDERWALIRCIHSTGDFAYEEHFESTPGAIENWASQLKEGLPVVTDVEMVRSGISPMLQDKYGTPVHCYLNDPDIPDIASEQGITRSKAGILRGLEKHPHALFVVGNAPTALIGLADAIKVQGADPSGVIGAPVGFVNVEESKHRLKACRHTPHVLITGSRGGSNVAASILNAALCLDEAEDRLSEKRSSTDPEKTSRSSL